MVSVSIITLCLAIQVQAPIAFVAPNLSSFDGSAWAGLKLGVSTDADIKKAYKTSKGAMRPEAMVLSGPDGPQNKVQALMRGRGKDAVLIGFRIDERTSDVIADDVVAQIEGEQQSLYLPDRYSDWKVVHFPARGILMIAENNKLRTSILTQPSLCQGVNTYLKTEVSSIQRYVDPFDELEVLATFSDISISTYVKGIDLKTKSTFESDLERRLERALDSSRRYRLSGRNAATLNAGVSANYDNAKGGTMSITTSCTLNTDWGPISGTGSGSESFKKGLGRIEWSNARDFVDVVDDALRNMGRDLERNYRAAIPPTAEAYNQRLWNNLINQVVK